MENIYKKLGKRIRTIRLQNKLSQEKLAELADLNVSFVSQIEHGATKFSLNTINKISDALDISLAELFDFTRKPKIKKEDMLVKYLYKLINSANKKDRKTIIEINKKLLSLQKHKK